MNKYFELIFIEYKKKIISIQYIFPLRYFYVLKHFLIDYIIHPLPVDVSHIL